MSIIRGEKCGDGSLWMMYINGGLLKQKGGVMNHFVIEMVGLLLMAMGKTKCSDFRRKYCTLHPY